MQYTYEIVTENENDVLDSVIKKSGITTEFKLQDVYNHKLKLEREIKEHKANVDIAKAKMENTESHHKEISKLIKSIKKMENPNGILATLFLWIKEDMERDNHERMAKEREELIKEYEDELDTIHDSLSIAKPVKIEYAKAN